jgi:hypothetical protein
LENEKAADLYPAGITLLADANPSMGGTLESITVDPEDSALHGVKAIRFTTMASRIATKGRMPPVMHGPIGWGGRVPRGSRRK